MNLNKISLLCLFCLLYCAGYTQTYIESSVSLGSFANVEDEMQDYYVENGIQHLLIEIQGRDFPSTDGTLPAGAADIAYARVDAQGNILFATQFGSGGFEEPIRMVVKDGIIHILSNLTFNTLSPAYPTTDGSTYISAAGFDESVAYTQLDAATGNIIFSTILSSSQGEIRAMDMEVSDDKVHILGFTDAPDYPTTDGTTYDDSFDLFYRVLDIATGATLFSTLIGDDGTETTRGLQISNGKAYIVGTVTDNTFASTDGSVPYPNQFSTFLVQYDETTFNLDFAGIVAPGTAQITASGEADGNFLIEGNILHVATEVVYYFNFFNIIVVNNPMLPTTTGIAGNGDGDIYYTRYDLTSKQPVATTHLGGAFGQESSLDLAYHNGKLHALVRGTEAPFFTNNIGDTDLGVYGSVYYRLDDNAYPEITRFFATSASPFDTDGVLAFSGDQVIIAGLTDINSFNETNPEIQKGDTDAFVAKLDANGALLYSTRLSSSLEESLGGGGFWELPFGVYADDDRIYVTGKHEGADFPVTDPILSGNDRNVYATVYKICSDVPFEIANDNITPAMQTNCQSGITQQLIGEEIIIDPNALPTLYENGLPRQQNIIEANYQWEFATASTGPWMEIEGATEKNFSPPPAATDRYYRRISREGPCCNNEIISTSSTAAVLVNSDVAPSVDAGGIFNTCPNESVTIGLANGTTGGTPPYTFLWDQGAGNTETVSVSPAETTVYTLSVTDNNGCQQIDQVIVNAYSANAGGNKSTCDNAPVRIGTPPIPGLTGVTYSWNNGGSLSCTDCAQPFATPNTPTTYTLTMTIPISGGGTCMTTDQVSVTPVAAPTTADFAGSDVVICQGATADIGTPAEGGFNYTWAPGNYLVRNDTSAVTFDPGSLEMPTPNPILYYLTAEQNGCTYVDEMTAAVITADAGVDGCGPRTVGTPDETPNINETYTWTKISGPGNIIGPNDIPEPTVSQSVGGATTYEVSVSYNGTTCTDQVVVPDCGCFVDIEVEAPAACPDFDLNGGNVTLIAFAADIFSQDPDEFTYSWSPQVGLSAYDERIVTLTDNVERTYTVTMGSPYDASFMCTQDIDVNVPAWSLPVFNPSAVQECANTPVQIGAPPVAGYEYTWSPDIYLNNAMSSNPTANVPSTTDFTVTVLDVGSGCEVQETVTVTTQVVADAGADKIVCDNGVIQLGNNTELPGYTYAWTPSGANWQNGTDENSAQPEVLVAINQTFTLTVTETATGCVSTDQVEVVVGTPVPPFSLSDIPFCPSDGSLQIGAGVPAGYSYSWNPSGLLDDATSQMPNLVTPLPSGAVIFQVRVGDPSGCNFKTTQRIVPTVTPPDAGTTQSACVGEAVDLGSGSNPVGAGISYTWTPTTDLNPTTGPFTTFTPTAAGTFTFTLEQDDNACVSSDEVTIFVNEANLPTFTDPTVCDGACVEIGTTLETGVTYQWSPSATLSDATVANPIACPTETTSYTLTATFTNGCIVTQDVLVSVNNENAPELTLNDQTVCLGDGGIMFSPTVNPAVGNYTYEWMPDDGTVSDVYALNPEIFAFGVGEQSYTLSVIDTDNGCSTEVRASLNVENCENAFNCVNPTATLTTTQGSCNGAVPFDDASINLNSVTDGNEAYYSLGATYAGPAYGTVGNLDVSSGSGSFTGLMHNTQYTVRVFNGANDCFTDETLTTPSITCTPSCTNPTFTSNTSQGTCNAGTANNDASISLSMVSNGDEAYYSTGATYSGPAYGTAGNLNVSGGSGSFTGLMHNTQYTVRVFNGANDCFTDETIITANITCTVVNYSLGNRVFADLDDNGIQTGAEPGIDGVVLTLLNGDGSPYDSDSMSPGVQTLSVTTGNGGYYRFDELPAGDYIVEVSASNFNAGTGALENLQSSSGAAQEASPNNDGDLNDNGLDVLVASAVRSGLVTLGGTEPTGESGPGSYAAGSTTGIAAADTENNLTVDFGFYAPPREDYPDYEDPSNPCGDLPCHTVSNDIYFGSGVTNDAAGSGDPTASADVDDGISISPEFDAVPGNVIRFPVSIFNNTGSDAYVRAWIDWNADGDFEDAGEQIYDNTYNTAGSFSDVISATIPFTAVVEEVIAMRWRISTDDTNSSGPCGTGTCAADGEIEDYLLRFSCPVPLCVPIQSVVRN